MARTAASWDNPDFVEVVIHSYRHRHRAAPGDPALAAIEARLAAQPDIPVPTINLHGAADGVGPVEAVDTAVRKFTGRRSGPRTTCGTSRNTNVWRAGRLNVCAVAIRNDQAVNSRKPTRIPP